jgi:hypothetical protein
MIKFRNESIATFTFWDFLLFRGSVVPLLEVVLEGLGVCSAGGCSGEVAPLQVFLAIFLSVLA